MAPAATMTYDRIRDPINRPPSAFSPNSDKNEERYFNTGEREFVAVYSRQP